MFKQRRYNIQFQAETKLRSGDVANKLTRVLGYEKKRK